MVLEFRPPKYGENGEVNRGDGSSFIDISGYHAIRDDIDRSVYRVGFYDSDAADRADQPSKEYKFTRHVENDGGEYLELEVKDLREEEYYSEVFYKLKRP